MRGKADRAAVNRSAYLQNRIDGFRRCAYIWRCFGDAIAFGAEETAKTGQGAARTNAHNHGIHIMLHLLPDFRSRRGFMGKRIGGICKLIDVMRAGNFRGDPLSHILIIFRIAFSDIGARHPHIGA